MGADDSHKAFLAEACKQQTRVERLIAADPKSGLGRQRLVAAFRKKGPVAAEGAHVKWTREIIDPEFQKNLRVLVHLIVGAKGISKRNADTDRKIDTDRKADMDGTTDFDRETLGALITLPSDIPLTIKVLLGRRFELEQKLVESGDAEYLRSRAADLYDEPAGTATTWRQLFDDEPPPLLREALSRVDLRAAEPNAERTGGPEGEHPDVERTRLMLARLLAVKEAQDLPVRARRELKQKALPVVVLGVAVATILFGVTIAYVTGWDNGAVLLAAAAGATGAALGGLIKLRDEVNLGAQMRGFRGFFVGELAVGAAAGLLAFVTVSAGIITVGAGDYGTAALAFAVGFSEAAFLGLVGRIAETVGGGRREN